MPNKLLKKHALHIDLNKIVHSNVVSQLETLAINEGVSLVVTGLVEHEEGKALDQIAQDIVAQGKSDVQDVVQREVDKEIGVVSSFLHEDTHAINGSSDLPTQYNVI